MEITRKYIQDLEVINSYRVIEPSIKGNIKKNIKYIVFNTLIFGGFGTYFLASETTFSFGILFFGYLFGVLSRDWHYMKESINLWYMLKKVINWDNVDKILNEQNENFNISNHN